MAPLNHILFRQSCFVCASISIPHVSRNTIQFLLCTVMLSTSPAHRLSSNSVMSSGRSFTVSMNRSIFLRRIMIWSICSTTASRFRPVSSYRLTSASYAPSPRAHDHHRPEKSKTTPPEGIKNQATSGKCLISRAFQPVCLIM